MKDLQKIAGFYRGILLFNLVMLLLIILLYPGQFSLLRDPVSWLGKAGPGEGLNFYSSFWLFSATLLFNIFRWNQIFSLLAQQPVWQNPQLRVASWAILAGFVLMLFPCDRFDPIHSTGGTLLGLGIWVISAMMLMRLKDSFASRLYYGLHIILHSAALFCIVNFALNTPLKGFSQRPVILAVVVVTNICLHLQFRVLRNAGRQDSRGAAALLRLLIF
jgi:hypothetical protein